MFQNSRNSVDKVWGEPSPITMMGPTCSEWTSWSLDQRRAYLRGYLEAEMFYRGVMSFQWKGKYGPALDRVIAHMDYEWPTPERTLEAEENAITRFYEDVRNQHVLFFPARRCVLLQLAGYPPSVVRKTILHIRKAQMDDPSFPSRMLKARWPSLEELETLSASRELDEEESWRRIQLTVSEKGPDEALPLLDTFLTAHPVHAQAFFLRGRLLLGKNDGSGIKDLLRVVEIDPSSLADCFELIAAFHHRQKDLEQANDYAALARQFRTILDAAESERVSVENEDTLIPHDLTEDVLSVIRDQMRRFHEIETCYLAQKAVRFLVDRHFYLLGVVANKVEDPAERDRSNTRLIMTIKQQLVLPDYTYVVVFDESMRVLFAKAEALPSAQLYTRGA